VKALTYTSQAHRDGEWWVIQNDQVPGAISQVARLDQAVDAQREAIAFVAGVLAESIDVVIRTVP
jgi:hypothetical protein